LLETLEKAGKQLRKGKPQPAESHAEKKAALALVEKAEKDKAKLAEELEKTLTACGPCAKNGGTCFGQNVVCKDGRGRDCKIAGAKLGSRCLTLRSGERDGEPETPPLVIVRELWRTVCLVLRPGQRRQVDIELLRPVEWLASTGAEEGGWVWLDLAEMDAEGEALVLGIDPCPEIEEGPGRIITGTFAHREGWTYDLVVEGEGEAIRVTGEHPFWSEDRQEYVSASGLREGERLLGTDGSRPRVVSNRLREETEPVYNIEVEGDHCYRVGEQGLLVHNNSVAADFEESCDSKDRCPDDLVKTYHKVPNYAYYLPIENMLPQGVRVSLKAPLKDHGPPTIDPPGYDGSINAGKRPPVIARGHILARSLGGQNRKENLFTICHQTSNTPWMSHIEVEVGKGILERKEEWYYEVKLVYSGNNEIPTRIKIRACTQQRDKEGKLTGLVYRTTAWLWDTGIWNQAGDTGIRSCKGAT
jgi:hypothetical protein